MSANILIIMNRLTSILIPLHHCVQNRRFKSFETLDFISWQTVAKVADELAASIFRV
jgi:hypothetical protein